MQPRRSRSIVAVLGFLVVLSLVAVPGVGRATHQPSGPGTKPTADKVILFASDGMRPDHIDQFIADGFLPTFAELINAGVKGDNGLIQAFPPNTGVGWSTIATGAYPGEHGSTNNTFHRTGQTFSFSTSFAATGILQADTIQQAAERAGKTVVSMEWVASRGLVPAMQGPVVDFRTFFSRRGIVLNYDLPGQPAGANAFGVDYQRVDLDDAKGWSNVPKSFSKAKQEQFTLTTTFSSANPTRVFDLYIYDSTNDKATNYDHVLVVPSTAAKNGAAAVADLTAGEWADVKVTLIGTTFGGRTGGFFMKAIEIEPDLSKFRLYFTSVARVNASYNALGSTGSAAFAETLASQFPTSTAADFAPLEAGIVDEDTYVQQGLFWTLAHHKYLQFILGSAPVSTVSGGTIAGLGVQPDLLLVGAPVTDEFQHQFLGLITPTDIDGNDNPFFDDVTNDDVPDGRVAIREGYIRSAYQLADDTLALARSLVSGDETVFVTSDHGFAPQWFAVNVPRALVNLGLQTNEQPGNCRIPSPVPSGQFFKAKECHAGGTSQIYLSIVGRDPDPDPTNPNDQIPAGQVPTVRNQIVSFFQSLDDPNIPGTQQVVDAVFTKEELRNVDGSDSLHPNRSGDVVVVFRPPYQTDAATPGQLIAPSQFFGQHGFLPDLVDLAHNVNLHAAFFAAGPGINDSSTPVPGVRAIDLAPTIAFLLDIPGPQNARGRILYEALDGAGSLQEFTVLNISDYHGQLTPLTERSDSVGPSFGIGGAAFLKPWFDTYRAEARDGSITVAGGDSIGATPPISSFFEDRPTIELMNAMGFDADGLGNHNFDRGQEFFREEQVPLADFRYVSANVLNSKGETPKEWGKSVVFMLAGTKVGIIGFTNPDAPELTKVGAFDPFVVTDPDDAVNQRAVQLRTDQVGPIVAVGHLGATSGTLTNPSGPLIDLADAVSNVDAVIGDHTNFQVLTTRPNGVLVTENLSRGLRFTRVRLVWNTVAREVVYKTADFHRPWNIGVTPDPAIQARIDELTAALTPILGTVIGSSTVEVPQTDACGNTAGRTCESKVGNAVTDAMRATYGVDFAITNSGGLRAALTCPPAGGGVGFCPSFTPPPWKITRGQVLAVLPFGNIVVTLTVNGAELKTMLENAVSTMPAVSGRFAQVSGLCFTYDISRPAGSRVVFAVRADSAGTCTTTPVDLTAASTYFIAENDFMVTGGDGYPNFSSRATSRDIMDQVVADHITAKTPISPSIQGRINCIKVFNPASTNNCPVVTP